MKNRIPIAVAKYIAGNYGYDQVIVYARRIGTPGLEWVTTYGKNAAHCSAAAKIGDAIRDNVTPTLEKQAATIADLTVQVEKYKARWGELEENSDD